MTDHDFPEIGVYRREVRKAAEERIAALEKLGVDTQALYILTKKIPGVASRLHQIRAEVDSVGLIPVISGGFLSIEEQLALITGKVEICFDFDPDQMKDTEKILPHHPYFMIGVDEGASTLGEAIGRTHKQILKEKKCTLTLIECTALAIHRDVLTRHGVWAGSTRWQKETFVYLKPKLKDSEEAKKSKGIDAILDYGYPDEAIDGVGIPSLLFRY